MALSSLPNPDFDQARIPRIGPFVDDYNHYYKSKTEMEKISSEMIELITEKVRNYYCLAVKEQL